MPWVILREGDLDIIERFKTPRGSIDHIVGVQRSIESHHAPTRFFRPARSCWPHSQKWCVPVGLSWSRDKIVNSITESLSCTGRYPYIAARIAPNPSSRHPLELHYQHGSAIGAEGTEADVDRLRADRNCEFYSAPKFCRRVANVSIWVIHCTQDPLKTAQNRSIRCISCTAFRAVSRDARSGAFSNRPSAAHGFVWRSNRSGDEWSFARVS